MAKGSVRGPDRRIIVQYEGDPAYCLHLDGDGRETADTWPRDAAIAQTTLT
jgi:hypothetical protein